MSVCVHPFLFFHWSSVYVYPQGCSTPVIKMASNFVHFGISVLFFLSFFLTRDEIEDFRIPVVDMYLQHFRFREKSETTAVCVSKFVLRTQNVHWSVRCEIILDGGGRKCLRMWGKGIWEATGQSPFVKPNNSWKAGFSNTDMRVSLHFLQIERERGKRKKIKESAAESYFPHCSLNTFRPFPVYHRLKTEDSRIMWILLFRYSRVYDIVAPRPTSVGIALFRIAIIPRSMRKQPRAEDLTAFLAPVR